MLNVSIVNNGMYETVFNMEDSKILRKCVIADDTYDAFDYLDGIGTAYRVVSYSCY